LERFLSKIFLFVFILGLGSAILAYSIDKGLRKTRYSYFAQWNDLFDSKINADILVLGSSRARQHFSTGILDSALSLNSYVIGLEAYRFRMYYDIFHVYLRHNKAPKYLIISLDIYSLHEDTNAYYYQQFLPYLDDPGIRTAYQGYRHSFTWADYYIPLYRYRGERTQIVAGLFEITTMKRHPEQSRKGYSSLDIRWDNTFNNYRRSVNNHTTQQTDPSDMTLLSMFLRECNSCGIVPILVFSPEYSGFQQVVANRETIISMYQDLAIKNNDYFIDFSDHPICTDTSYFYNSQHLNSAGSIQFSKDLTDSLKKVVMVKPTEIN
jgi:hypothetical protein